MHNGDARLLLSSAVRFKLDERVRDRIIAETRGNPLALLELPRGLTATQLAGGFGLLEAQGLTGRIEESFVRRIEMLSDDTRHFLLLAAAEPLGDPLLLWRAAERLAIGPAAAESAEATGLVAVGTRVLFRHPLVRSAVYRAATVEDRRVVHSALAETTDRSLDPDRRAWHLASAAAGPDEHVALELERSAGRAQARGGLAAGAAFLQRAVALSADPALRTERALAGAEASLSAGAFGPALALLAAAESGPLDELQRATAGTASARRHTRKAVGATRRHCSCARRRRSRRLTRSLRAKPIWTPGARPCSLDGSRARAASTTSPARHARAPPAPSTARPSDLLLDGFALLLTDGRAAATPLLQQAATGFAGDAVAVEEVLRWGWLATIAAVIVWDYESCVAVASRGVAAGSGVWRSHGARAVALNIMAQAVALGGDYRRAAQLISEADAVTEATGDPGLAVRRHLPRCLPGSRGRRVEARRRHGPRRPRPVVRETQSSS